LAESERLRKLRLEEEARLAAIREKEEELRNMKEEQER
jgi:hypothetical protein